MTSAQNPMDLTMAATDSLKLPIMPSPWVMGTTATLLQARPVKIRLGHMEGTHGKSCQIDADFLHQRLIISVHAVDHVFYPFRLQSCHDNPFFLRSNIQWLPVDKSDALAVAFDGLALV